VTGKSAGTATITATAQDGSGKSKSCTVTVTGGSGGGNQGSGITVTINPTQKTLNIGDTFQPTATASSGGIIWSVLPYGVVTVSSTGLVKAIGTGTATVTAKSAVDGSKFATCTVTVMLGTVIYDMTPEGSFFIDSLMDPNGPGGWTFVQSYKIWKLFESGNTVTASQIAQILGISSFPSSSVAVMQLSYNLSTFGMTLAEAEIRYQQERSSAIQVMLGFMVLNVISSLPYQNSVIRIGDSTFNPNSSLDMIEYSGLTGNVYFQKGSGYVLAEQTNLNFTNTTTAHMNNQGRAVPVQILKETITSTTPYPDPQGTSAKMHYTTMYRNGQMYNLEVLYDIDSNTIMHFMYSRNALGPLSAIPE